MRPLSTSAQKSTRAVPGARSPRVARQWAAAGKCKFGVLFCPRPVGRSYLIVRARVRAGAHRCADPTRPGPMRSEFQTNGHFGRQREPLEPPPESGSDSKTNWPRRRPRPVIIIAIIGGRVITWPTRRGRYSTAARPHLAGPLTLIADYLLIRSDSIGSVSCPAGRLRLWPEKYCACQADDINLLAAAVATPN